MNILRTWKKKSGDVEDSIDITDSQIFIGHEEGFGHGSSGAACSWAEFSNGRLNQLVEKTFGKDVLNEVLAFVKMPNLSFKRTPDGAP